jgi:hypothetical protein
MRYNRYTFTNRYEILTLTFTEQKDRDSDFLMEVVQLVSCTISVFTKEFHFFQRQLLGQVC